MKFTKEEMIVVSVWYHEKRWTNMTTAALDEHFLKRFGKEAPRKNSILRWEKRLFSSNLIRKKQRNNTTQRMKRFAYIPYILDSLAKYPDMNLSKRSKMLGINTTTLSDIIKTEMDDLQEFLPKKGEEPSKNASEQDQKQSNNTNVKSGGS